MVTALIGVAYVAFSDAFIKGLLPAQFSRALGVLALINIFRAFDFTTRLPDQIFWSASRTGTYTWTAIVEHLGRIALSWYLIKRFGFPGLFYAFTASAALKSVIAWPLVARLVVRLRFSPWQTFINPLIAAAGDYLILRMGVAALWRGPGHLGNTWLIVMGCLIASFPIYMLLSGLLGWDALEMSEFRDAAEIVPPPFRILALFAYRIVSLGSAISPFYDRFPAKLATAVEEAAILTGSEARLH
jgi:O-antigen/teichoic acid export membrane protein